MHQIFSRVAWAENVKVTGRSSDGGIDFEGMFIERQSGLKSSLYGQAKHWKSKVGSETIRTFIGFVAVKETSKFRSSVGVYACTGGFSEEAQNANQEVFFCNHAL